MLKIENVSKSYVKGTMALDNINIDLKPGSIYGFIGHNGAGKTTLIKAIVGIHDFESGDILINNISIKKDPIACKKIMAYIPDSPDIYPNLKAIDYLNFIADMYQVHVEKRNNLIETYAKKFEIYEDLSNQIDSFSHGMKQKLVIISALVHEPKLLILDEPFVGLDPSASFTLKTIMKDLCKTGVTIFLSSHVLEVVEKICDNITLIKEGKIIISGPTKKVVGNKSLELIFLELNND